MRKIKTAILFGGCSTEYEISLQSVYGVLSHMNKERYEPFLVGVTRDGRWLLYNGGAEKIQNDTWQEDSGCIPAILSPDRTDRGLLVFHGDRVERIGIDVIFPVLHGKNGEDGTVQGIAELADIPVAGCGLLSSAICMDKDVAHKLAAAAGISVPPSVTVRQGETEEQIIAMTQALKYPLFVKPAAAGSSIGISRIMKQEELYHAVLNALRESDKAVIEQEIKGFEVGCAVLGQAGALTVGEVDEIELSQGFLDYEEKYGDRTAQIRVPAGLDREQTENVKSTALKLYQALECSGFARVDMFLTPEGEIIFNEINTIPGLTAHSRFPNMLGAAGTGFAKMLDILIQSAVNKA